MFKKIGLFAAVAFICGSTVAGAADFIPLPQDMVISWRDPKGDVKCTIYDVVPDFDHKSKTEQRAAYEQFVKFCSARQAAEEIPADKR